MTTLPAAFRELEIFVPLWAFASENQRSEKRWRSSPGDFEAFYKTMLPRIEEILAYLDKYPIDAIPVEAKPLYHLATAFAEAAPHVEMYKSQAEVPNSFDARRFVAAHGAIAD
jgi:hypothetical protein